MSSKTSYDGTFDTAFLIVVGSEGYYSNDPDDPGGETKFGVSKKSYPNLDIKKLDISGAKEIYYRDFWTRLNPIEKELKLFVFDASINQGLNFTNAMIDKINNISMLTLEGRVEMIYSARLKRYDEIILKKPVLEKYRRGWINRIDHIYTLTYDYINSQKKVV